MSDTPRTGEPRRTLSTLLNLVSFALVAGLTTIVFGVASFSTLYVSEATPSYSGYRYGSQEVEHGRSAVFPYIHHNRRPVSRETDPQSSAAEVTVSVLPDLSPAHHMRPPEVSEPSPPGVGEASVTQDASLSGTTRTARPEVSGPSPPGVDEGSATQDASVKVTTRTVRPEVSEPSPPGVGEASVTQDASLSGTTRTVRPEVSGPSPPGVGEESATLDASLSGTARTARPEVSGPSPPGVGEASITLDASLSGTTRTVRPEVSAPSPPGVGEENATQDAWTARPEVSGPSLPGVGEASVTQDASLNGTTLSLPDPALQGDKIFRKFSMHQVPKATLGTPHAGMPMQNMQEGQTHDLSNNVAFWMYRERKECGPITDRALRADCVSSFRAQYRLHYAGPTKGTRDFKILVGQAILVTGRTLVERFQIINMLYEACLFLAICGMRRYGGLDWGSRGSTSPGYRTAD